MYRQNTRNNVPIVTFIFNVFIFTFSILKNYFTWDKLKDISSETPNVFWWLKQSRLMTFELRWLSESVKVHVRRRVGWISRTLGRLGVPSRGVGGCSIKSPSKGGWVYSCTSHKYVLSKWIVSATTTQLNQKSLNWPLYYGFILITTDMKTRNKLANTSEITKNPYLIY